MPKAPKLLTETPATGTRNLLEQKGPQAVADWMKEQKKVLLTDTTMRDGHQSLLATRFRTNDLLNIADAYAHLFPELFSLEMWGGATFDVALEFCPAVARQRDYSRPAPCLTPGLMKHVS